PTRTCSGAPATWPARLPPTNRRSSSPRTTSSARNSNGAGRPSDRTDRLAPPSSDDAEPGQAVGAVSGESFDRERQRPRIRAAGIGDPQAQQVAAGPDIAGRYQRVGVPGTGLVAGFLPDQSAEVVGGDRIPGDAVTASEL